MRALQLSLELMIAAGMELYGESKTEHMEQWKIMKEAIRNRKTEKGRGREKKPGTQHNNNQHNVVKNVLKRHPKLSFRFISFYNTTATTTKHLTSI